MRTQKNKNVIMFTLMERLWHWIQAFSMIALAITGVAMHYHLGKMEGLTGIHHLFGWIVAINFIVWFFYMIVTGRIKQYIPYKGDEYPMGLFKQAKFYIFQIYTSNDHPYHVTAEHRMNPLQKVTYVSVMFLMLPIQMITGFLIMFGMADMKTMLIVHLLAGAFFVLFIFGHAYLATTGHTPLAFFKEMIHGYEEDVVKEEK